MTRAVLTPRAVWWRARAPVGLSKLCQLLALSAWHGIAQERSAGSSIKQISALTHFASAQSPAPAGGIDINRPPTGGDLTFSWKEGHICTVVLLEVLSQLCHGGGGVQALSVVGGRQSRTRV